MSSNLLIYPWVFGTLLEYGILPVGFVIQCEELELTIEVDHHAPPGDNFGMGVIDDAPLE